MTNGAVLAFEQTIAHATNIPSANYEHFRGNSKEHYKEHTDHILAQIEVAQGLEYRPGNFPSEAEGEPYFLGFYLKISLNPVRKLFCRIGQTGSWCFVLVMLGE